jgi:hypothetical protein
LGSEPVEREQFLQALKRNNLTAARMLEPYIRAAAVDPETAARMRQAMDRLAFDEVLALIEPPTIST